MRFRPTFCAHCGERIERSEWRIWTSRRFCAVCESEYKGQDLIPQAFMALCLAIGLFGIGSYIKSGTAAPEHRVVREPQRFVERQPAQQLAALNPPAPAANSGVPTEYQLQNQTPQYTQNPPVIETAAPPNVSVAPPTVIQRPIARVEQTVHYCGAETKKGTPCARRVKGPTRCYQHVGMPAMSLATEPSAVPNKSKTK